MSRALFNACDRCLASFNIHARLMYSNLAARVKRFLGKATFSCKMSPKYETRKRIPPNTDSQEQILFALSGKSWVT